jgi:hypothetical protein
MNLHAQIRGVIRPPPREDVVMNEHNHEWRNE